MPHPNLGTDRGAMPRPTTAIPRMAPPQEQTPERQNNSYAAFNSRNPKRRLTLQNGGYACGLLPILGHTPRPVPSKDAQAVSVRDASTWAEVELTMLGTDPAADTR